MKIGFDLDNTIICYDRAFSELANEVIVLPDNIKKNKSSIKHYLVSNSREEDWTKLQGMLYGPYLKFAEPFPGVIDCFHRLAAHGFDLCIISHKTFHPVKGKKYRLRDYATNWIRHHLSEFPCFFKTDGIQFCDTLNNKIAKINNSQCGLFVDDLTSVLSGIDDNIKTVLFSPCINYKWTGSQAQNWDYLNTIILEAYPYL